MRSDRDNHFLLFSWCFMLSALLLVVVATTLPNTSLAWLRAEYRWFGQPLNWIESHFAVVGLIHIMLFALLGGAASVALRHWPISLLLSLLVALAALSELVQFWIPGRTPRISDFTADVVGAVVGVAVVWGGQWLWQWWQRERVILPELSR